MRDATNHIGWEIQQLTLLSGWQRYSDVFTTREGAEDSLAVFEDSLLWEFRIYESVE